MGRAYQKVLAKKSLAGWGAASEGRKAKAGGELLRGGVNLSG